MSATLHALIDVAAALPRVDDPWPRTIGLGFPFSMAGVGGVLANVFWTRGSEVARDRATSIGGLWGFRIGALAYFALSVNQVLSIA